MAQPGRDYVEEGARLRGIWSATVGIGDEQAIRERACCSETDAFRVACVRRGMTFALERLWHRGALTWRQFERIAITCARDEAAQLDAAGEYPKARRLIKSST